MVVLIKVLNDIVMDITTDEPTTRWWVCLSCYEFTQLFLLNSAVRNDGLPVRGFSCSASSPPSKNKRTYLFTLVRLTGKPLAIWVRDFPCLKCSRASNHIFIWILFCWLTSFLKSVLLRLSIVAFHHRLTASIRSCFYYNWYYYPDASKEKRYASRLLNRQFNPDSHNTHWVTDVMLIRSHQGWSYLACVMDLGTKEIVGYSLSRSPDTKLTLAALNLRLLGKNRIQTNLSYIQLKDAMIALMHSDNA